jgi:uncharacterized protein YbjT (DUF2867 family)
MKILVTGAGGFIGSHVVRALRHVGHEVICCGRNKQRLLQLSPDCSAVEADFSCTWTLEQWLPILKDIAVVVNAAGIIQEHGPNTFSRVHRDGPIELFKAAQQAGVRGVVQISALGADGAATTDYHQTKKAADDFLANLPIEWIILRPSIVYGAGARSQEFFAALAALPFIPLAGDGSQRIQPVWIKDLVAAVMKLVEPGAPNRQHIDVVGPEPISIKAHLEMLRSWLGLSRTRALPIPLGLVRAMGRVGSLFRLEFVNASTVSMLCRENIGDPRPLARVLGASPHSCAAALRNTPSRQADGWHAGLYFLRPLLRISIATVWLAAGVLSLCAFPQQESEALLIRTGVLPWMAPPVLMGTSVLDIGLGLATLFRWRPALVLGFQLILIATFSGIIALSLPEFWLHPFGPLVKNGPLFVGTLMLLAMERK